MKHFALFSAYLIATVTTGVAMAQIAVDPAYQRPDPSVAYVYVARPTHVDGFAASASGKLTPVPGSPFPNIKLDHLSVTSKFLFGTYYNADDIYSFSIGSNGALKQVSETNPHKYDFGDCFGGAPIQPDQTGTTLYYAENNCDGLAYVQSYKIEGNGDLQFLAQTYENIDSSTLAFYSFRVLGNNTYAYQAACGFEGEFATLNQYQRESNGVMTYTASPNLFPATEDPDDYYCAIGNGFTDSTAVDRTDHLVLALSTYNGMNATAAPAALATYTTDSHGNLITKSTYENMPTSPVLPTALSVSPSGELLAVGGIKGLQVFHFNGSDPITHYTGVLQSGSQFVKLGWDKDNHLYALSTDKLYVYTVTPTNVKEASGSPYSIPEAATLIVLSLK
jgi:hypothetical protein